MFRTINETLSSVELTMVESVFKITLYCADTNQPLSKGDARNTETFPSWFIRKFPFVFYIEPHIGLLIYYFTT